jgi:hypothetical protein
MVTRLIKGTIWDESLLTEVPRRFRSLYTIVLPIKYGFFFLFGVIGLIADTAPTLAVLTSPSYVEIWTLVIGACAAISFVGLAIQHFRMELYATVVLSIMLFSYPLALIVEGFGDIQKLDLGVGLLVFLVMPVWRVFDIVRTERRRARD